MRELWDAFYRFLIRASSFVGKEIFEIIRQPMLLLSLILGPFMILLLFGLGFHNDPQPLHTLFVVPGGGPLAQQIENYATDLGPQLIYEGVTSDEAEAKRQLSRRQVDVVAVIPADALERIRNSEQATLTLYHNEVDPFQVDYINVFGRVYSDEVNRRLLHDLIQQEQGDAAGIEGALGTARQTTADLRAALEAGETQTAQQNQDKLHQDVGLLAMSIGTAVGLAEGMEGSLGGEDQSAAAVMEALDSLQENTNSLEEIDPTNDSESDLIPEKEKVSRIEDDLAELETLVGEFRSIAPQVMISPFRSQIQSISAITLQPLDFFAPAVIALLLQHLSLTFAALSIVHEKRGGSMELFRVAPISAFETLLGKYLSYLIFASIIAVALTLLVVFGLGVPLLGDLTSYGLSLFLMIFASLSLGFVISLLAKTDTQAVQYSMIFLLCSIFFSGAFMNLSMLGGPVKVVSWALPATYGIQMLQDIMLRGIAPNPIMIGGLVGIGLLLTITAGLMLGRTMARQ